MYEVGRIFGDMPQDPCQSPNLTDRIAVEPPPGREKPHRRIRTYATVITLGPTDDLRLPAGFVPFFDHRQEVIPRTTSQDLSEEEDMPQPILRWDGTESRYVPACL